LIGIPGVGKTYLLNLFKKTFRTSINLIDFGEELRKITKFVRQKIRTRKQFKKDEYYSQLLLNKILKSKLPAVITSHLVFKRNKKYLYSFNLDKRANCIAYIHLLAPAREILRRKIKDNKQNLKKRPFESTKSIDEHQKKSLEKTIEIADKIDSPVFVIKNIFRLNKTNLLLLYILFKYFLKNGSRKKYGEK